MAGPLLATKLHLPRRRRAEVARSRLIERLAPGWEAALTLVSAPAGFGKTTLLTAWLTDPPTDPPSGRSVAWLALDARDNDPAVFWTYVVASLQRAAPGVGAQAQALLASGQAPVDTVLATLVNDLDALPGDLVLVLDDYHVIETPELHEGLAFLLDHLPSQVHVVVATRADPPLPLARLRARGQLVEVRAADLRFTLDEAGAYLDDVMDLTLTPADVAALEGRTEGWIAALQLAALSLQGRDDATGFIAGFAGDDRYVVDYLVEEVLQRQPAHVRAFLLQTSVLSRLTGPLCDAVTGQDDGIATLESLERANLFLVPLDDRRRWYRYHHLFADVLQAHLLAEEPDRVATLHRRASDWCEQHDDQPEALRHALAARDFGRAADLLEVALPAMRQERREATLRRALDALPDDTVRARPVLTLAAAGVRLQHGELDGVEKHLRDAEDWLAGADARAADPELLRTVRAGAALFRAAQATVHGDVAGTIAHARRVLEVVGDEVPLERGAAAGLLGLAYWSLGDLDAGHRWWVESVAALETAGHQADVLGGCIALGDIRATQGRLRDAAGAYEKGLRIATQHGPPPLRGAADMHVGLSVLLRERDDLEAARSHLRTSQDLGAPAALPQNRHRWGVASARVRIAEGDLAGALRLLDEAQAAYVGDMFPDTQPVAAWRARVRIAQGDLSTARGWARDRGLTADDELTYLREFEHVTLARLLLAEHAAEHATEPTAEHRAHALDLAGALLGRLAPAAEGGGRTGSLIEILMLQALAAQAGGDLPGAVTSLRRALALAEPEGYVRVFVDEGPRLTALLQAVSPHGAYVRRLLDALSTSSTPEAGPSLVDPLSPRELDVLRLLGGDLDGPGIARELVVSLHTVRSHTKAVYAKLGVTSRRAAVRRARELHLLP
ncbi:LuxR C-terminal-related transcriptional regulator [Cellulomonas sp. URHB0016]